MERRRPRRSALVVLAVLWCTVGSAAPLAATVTWDGDGGNGLWSDPLNWSGDVMPESADDVTIAGNVGTVHLDTDFTVGNRLDVGNFFASGDVDTLVIDPGVTLNIENGSDVLVFTSGTLLNDGIISMVVGAELIANSGPLTNNAGGLITGAGIARTTNDGAQFTNNGTWSGPAFYPSRGMFSNNGTFEGPIATHPSVPSVTNNNLGATMTILSYLQIRNTDDVFNNLGTVNNSGSAENSGTFHNEGTLDNTGGTFTNLCGAGFTGSGVVLGGPIIEECKTWDSDAGNQLWSDPLNWSLDSLPTSSDRVLLDGTNIATVVHVDVDVTLDNRLELLVRSTDTGLDDDILIVDSGVTLTNNSTIDNRQRRVINDGTFINAATFNNIGHLNLGNAVFDNNGQLTNTGTFQNKAHGQLTNDGTIDNQGQFNNACDGIFVNTGTVQGTPIFEECMSWDGGGGNGLWSDPLNWSTDIAPASGNDIAVAGDVGMVYMDVDFTVGNRLDVGDFFAAGDVDTLVIDSHITLSIENGGDVLVFTSGTLLNDGVISMSVGAELIANSGRLTNNPGGLITGAGIARTTNDGAQSSICPLGDQQQSRRDDDDPLLPADP